MLTHRGPYELRPAAREAAPPALDESSGHCWCWHLVVNQASTDSTVQRLWNDKKLMTVMKACLTDEV